VLDVRREAVGQFRPVEQPQERDRGVRGRDDAGSVDLLAASASVLTVAPNR
jgi:hypothetical protein